MLLNVFMKENHLIMKTAILEQNLNKNIYLFYFILFKNECFSYHFALLEPFFSLHSFLISIFYNSRDQISERLLV